jgi:hypothetical protein
VARGLLAEVLLARLPEVTVRGLDGSVEMLERARERLARAKILVVGARGHIGRQLSLNPQMPTSPTSTYSNHLSAIST